MNFKTSLFSSYFLIIFIRKYHIDFHIILCIYPDQLIFKSRNESSASQLQLRVCSFQIIRALSIHIPGKINGKHISLFCRTIHVFQLQILFLVIPYLFDHIFVCHFCRITAHFQTFVLSKRYKLAAQILIEHRLVADRCFRFCPSSVFAASFLFPQPARARAAAIHIASITFFFILYTSFFKHIFTHSICHNVLCQADTIPVSSLHFS